MIREVHSVMWCDMTQKVQSVMCDMTGKVHTVMGCNMTGKVDSAMWRDRESTLFDGQVLHQEQQAMCPRCGNPLDLQLLPVPALAPRQRVPGSVA